MQNTTNENVFPKLKITANPHEAMCEAAQNVITYSKSFSNIKRFLSNIIDKGGMGFDYSSGFTCSYDADYMDELHVDAFGRYEKCLVGSEDSGLVYTLYSIEELEGWLVLLAISAAELKDKNWKRPLLSMLGRRFDVNKSLTSLYRKLAGDLEWSDGPKGDIATDSYLESWKAMHNQKIADAFFRCVNDDFMINGIDLPDDSGSPLSSAPRKETVFPDISKYTNPHASLTRPLDWFLNQDENTDGLLEALKNILDGNDHVSPELGTIWCNFDSSWMNDAGIETFEPGEYYIVKSLDTSFAQWFVYTKAEFQGWIVLITVGLGKKRIFNRQEKIDQLIKSRFDYRDRVDPFIKKISGQEKWHKGPIGQSLTQEAMKSWQAQHSAELKSE